jgi:hypothetical protein
VKPPAAVTGFGSSLSPSRQDALWAAGAGIVALAVYVRTLAPGLTSDVDTAMFQFIGRVLGVAHNPGYPLYVLLTYPFSFLPLGTLAYRINFFSALMGGLTVSLAFLVMRRLGCRRLVSLAAALGLAFGRVFWSQAVIAEVYTLNTAIVAGIFLALIAWNQTRRAGRYFAAVGLFAAGLGNHTTILGFAPGMVLYVLLTDRRFAMRLSTLATTAAILAVGLVQYGFIILRSNQPGAYVESKATTVPALLGVMLGSQFQDRLFAFGWRALLVERVPSFVTEILAPELTVVGLVLAAAGTLWLLRHRLRESVLLLTGCLTIIAFALNYSVVDTPVFLIPAILVLWLLVGIGVEWTVLLLGRQRWSAVGVSLTSLLVPAWLLAQNFATTDRSSDTRASVELDRLFAALPDRAALVHQDFLADRMVMAKLLGDGAGRGRHIEIAPPDPRSVRGRLDDGVGVFAFGKAAERLRYDGVNVSFAPLALVDGPLDAFLSRLPDGTIVALSVPAGFAGQFARSPGVSLTAIGGPSDLAAVAATSVAIAGVRGTSGAAVEVGRNSAVLDFQEHTIGDTGKVGPRAVEIRSEPFEAMIRQGSRDIVRTSQGVAMAIWRPDGRLLDALVLQSRDGFQVPISQSALSVYPLRGISPSQAISANAWVDVAGSLQTGSVMLRAPAGEAVVLYLADDTPLAPRVFNSTGRAHVDVTTAPNVAGTARAAGEEVGADQTAALDRDGHAYRIEVDAFGPGPVSVLLALGGVPTYAIGRVIRAGASRAADLFSVDTGGLLRTPDRASEVLLMGRDDQSQLTGDGWSAVDSDAAGPFRWMTSREARVMLPVATHTARRIRIQVLRVTEGRPMTVRLRVNGADLPSQPLQTGWHVYEWDLPPGVVSVGINEAALLVDQLSVEPRVATTSAEIAVAEVRLIHGEP